MAYAPTLRMIRDAIEAQARVDELDDVTLESLLDDIARMIQSIRVSTERAREFSARGLISEAASVVDDFPNLAMQADRLAAFPQSTPTIARFWSSHVDAGAEFMSLPTPDDIDMLVSCVDQSARLHSILAAYRSAVLRREPMLTRLALLRKLREANPQNRMWLDQILALEQGWLKLMAAMRTDDSATTEDLEGALASLSERDWIAPVPRGLREQLLERLQPLRDAQAAARYASLIVKIDDARALMDRAAIKRLQGEWEKVLGETGCDASDEQSALVTPAFDWVERVENEAALQRDFDARVVELERAITAEQPLSALKAQLASLRGSGGSVPQRLVELIDAREKAAIVAAKGRRTKTIVLSAIALVVVVAVVVAGAIFYLAWEAKETSKQVERDASDKAAVDQLTSALTDGDLALAHEKAEDARKLDFVPSAELAALLAREAQASADLTRQQALVKSELERCATEIATRPTPEKMAVLNADLSKLQSLPMSADERVELDRMTTLIGAELATVNTARATALQTARASALHESAAFGSAESWSSAERNDPERWHKYGDALARMKTVMESARTLAATADSVPPTRAELDTLTRQLAEARNTEAALRAVYAALSRHSLGAPVGDEAQFIARLRELLQAHGAALSLLALLEDFEKSASFEPAWNSVKFWREQISDVIVAAQRDRGNEELKQQALSTLANFTARYPGSPYATGIQRLQTQIEQSIPPLTKLTALEIQQKLGERHYADIQEVPLSTPDCFFFRRVTRDSKLAIYGAIKERRDVALPLDKLSAMLLRPGEYPLAVRKSTVSDAWKKLESDIERNAANEISLTMRSALENISTLESSSTLFQLRALYDLSELYQQSGYASDEEAKLLHDWRSRCDKSWFEAVGADWPAIAFAVDANSRALLGMGGRAVKLFPKFSAVGDAATPTFDGGFTATLDPIGVLMHAEAGATTREFVGIPVADGQVVVLVKLGDNWSASRATLQGNYLPANINGLPLGPLLVYREITPAR